jgi:hypothetical protein
MSEIKVNKISPKQTCTQLTLGDSGDTIIIPAGATITNNGTATGFGRTGTVNWDTTPKTTNFTAVSGNGYFVDTNTTATLPSTPAAGDIVAIADYANTAAINNITVGRNSSPIDGSAVDAKIKINGQVYTLVYVDSTEGWKTVGQTFNQISTAEFVAATGGTITTSGDYKIHSFTGPGTFTVTNAGNPAGSTTVDYLVVAGGAGGGWGGGNGGGGGAGGYRQNFPSPAIAGLPVTAQAYPITVGAGGAGGTGPTAPGSSGANSIFSTITSAGGGGGGSDDNHPTGKLGGAGGSGGGSGGGGGAPAPQAGGAGNTPPTSPPQGSPGGTVNSPGTIGGAGGGGHAAAGASIPGGTANGGAGGAGSPLSITGSPVFYAGGGGGGADAGGTGGSGGNGGGGNGGSNNSSSGMTAGTTNTGGGGGGNGQAAAGAAGGSGIVIIRYKFQ